MTDLPATPSVIDPERRLMAPARVVLRRWKQRNALLVFLLAGLVAALVVLIMRLAGSGFPALPIVFGALTFGLLITMMINRGAGGRLLWLIDRRAGRDQAYATATRLALDHIEPGPVGRVLLQDQAEAARQIDPRGIIALPGLPAIGAAVALIVVMGANFWLADQRALENAPLDDTIAVDEAPIPALDESVNTIATRIAEDARESGNEYLAAVARALTEAAEELANAPDDAALQQEVSDLLEHARRAYGDTPPSWMGQPDSFSAQQMAQNIDEQIASEARAAERAAQRAEEGFVDIYERDDARLEALYSDRNETELLSNVDASAMRPSDVDLEGGVAPDEGEPRRMDDAELEMIGGAPIGAAMESGKGESEMAGGGSQELADDTTPAGPEITAANDMTLSSNAEATGNRIRIDAAPPMAGAGGDAASGSSGGFDDTQIARAAMGAARLDIPPAARAMIARYLDRSSTSQNGPTQ
ncbi:hypothetical protein [Ketogulonicigenium vulgare]|uniref:Uncharacterized protein n=1 Tax=Ketogulonicigenium vulgare (strain WSH-001) TaxID=759362 RepID=F9Y5Q9_KETVW|nr:hypothetical protein [Ketogulonicigenium vulgare]ADO43716.1 hypothetical protein EIO_2639 [Ketogulonicigenium vulgare Y25]AEM41984.1 hypothetical protein KVU_2145 [Ketogulonicigenium vulgare WSH-001]ALJ82081.1 hypothetical protein KVH_13460 [Ketogulonicigenium vulgare]ANW34705.1 hypothetical protein KvSKV_13370 [Ketogulonicigenium vulgare]AOZ55749.1 hypothetical protein KVC_2747 [Ketogulonicigenium vulgare]